ncbi:hypothetical protein AKO1_000243 [Acrasis kona]|uniref:Uncharacterized protein n=1 Tax=Acrasis kona TaxID=1008807 RepID=A0AAW2ZF39_9EUKA
MGNFESVREKITLDYPSDMSPSDVIRSKVEQDVDGRTSETLNKLGIAYEDLATADDVLRLLKYEVFEKEVDQEEV